MAITISAGAWLVEDAVSTLIEYLRGTLNDAIASVYADYATAEGANRLAMPPVAPSSYFVSESLKPLRYPAIKILADETTFDVEEGQLLVKAWHDLLVCVIVEDMEEDRLTRLTWRYARALFKALHPLANGAQVTDLMLGALGSQTGRLAYFVKAVQYGGIFRNMGGGPARFRKDANLRVRCMHNERF